jgi:cytochrome o ubiquinol oxidase operon protein cyoD
MNRTAIDRAGASRGNFKSYATGFILSIVLTAIAFGLVMQGGGVGRWAVLLGVFGAAIVQILVHLHFFLHMDTSSAPHWNVLALVFTVLIIILFVGGTLWIMSSLNYRMM